MTPNEFSSWIEAHVRAEAVKAVAAERAAWEDYRAEQAEYSRDSDGFTSEDRAFLKLLGVK